MVNPEQCAKVEFPIALTVDGIIAPHGIFAGAPELEQLLQM